MNIADCPYIDGKCGEHADCVKCDPQKQWIEFLKSKIATSYYRLLPDDAALKNAKYIAEWLNGGFITDADAAELRTHNGELWWKYA